MGDVPLAPVVQHVAAHYYMLRRREAPRGTASGVNAALVIYLFI